MSPIQDTKRGPLYNSPGPDDSCPVLIYGLVCGLAHGVVNLVSPDVLGLQPDLQPPKHLRPGSDGHETSKEGLEQGGYTLCFKFRVNLQE